MTTHTDKPVYSIIYEFSCLTTGKVVIYNRQKSAPFEQCPYCFEELTEDNKNG